MMTRRLTAELVNARDSVGGGAPDFVLLDVTGKNGVAIWRDLRYVRHMPTDRHVKLFKNGRNQAVRIPREFELPGEDALMRKEGQRLIIEPVPPTSLLALLAALEPIEEDFPAIPELALDPVKL